jgi:hypothetical protein
MPVSVAFKRYSEVQDLLNLLVFRGREGRSFALPNRSTGRDAAQTVKCANQHDLVLRVR